MPAPFEMVIPRRPMTFQTNNREALRSYKEEVRALALGLPHPFFTGRTWLSLIYLCDTVPPDVDNIIKPIQDALAGVVYGNDIDVSDVDSHRRYLNELDLELPPLLLRALESRYDECVYVRVISLYDSWLPFVEGTPV